MRRRTFIALGVGAGAVLAARPLPRSAPGHRAAPDLVLRGGVVVDGTGRPRFRADVAITGDRITAIADDIPSGGAREIDCRGHVVSPGFVDIHSHADGSLFADPLMESTVRQGVTSVVIGADGNSRAPGGSGSNASVRALLGAIDELRPGANVGTLIGLGTARGFVVGGGDRRATPAQLARMTALVEAALAEGALGASSGLEYTPGAFASPEELVALCAPLGPRALAYHTHMRNEDDRVLEALDEAIAVARDARCGLQVSHLKTMGPRNWGRLDEVFARLEAARADGLDVAFDRYPYLAYQTGLTSLFPVWSRAAGIDGLLARAGASATAARVRAETLAKVELIGGWDNIQVTTVAVPQDKAVEGARLGAEAARRGADPYRFALDLLRRSSGNVGMVGFAMSEDNLDRLLAHDLGMVASDGGALAQSGPARRGVPHPRGGGSFARVLGTYVRERGALTLEQAVRKMSAYPASRLRLADRGWLVEGAHADLAVFDPATVADRATFTDPFQYAVGIKATIVNGVVAFLDGERGPRAGRALRPAGWSS
jgi:N-acyl-D-amino-acid deacylase